MEEDASSGEAGWEACWGEGNSLWAARVKQWEPSKDPVLTTRPPCTHRTRAPPHRLQLP